MRNVKQKAIDWMIILGISILASIPLMMSGIHRGHDIGFHLLRMEGIAAELKSLQFPVKMQSLWLEGYGYPVSIYYGDLLLYIPAVLRIIGFPMITAYKAYILFINIATAAVAYFCFEKMWNNRKIAVIVSLAYVTSGYRLLDIYVRAAVGEYSAMIFLPLIALSIYQIYMSKDEGKKEYKKNALMLCLGMTGLIGTHILSTEMTVFILILLCIVLWKKTFRKEIILTYLLAVVNTLLLTLYFIVPFLDYYLNVRTNINVSTGANHLNQIQSTGAYLIQYFSFFHNIFGFNSVNINERMQLSPGPLLMFALILGIIVYIKKRNKKVCLYLSFSLLMLFFASNIFPWDFLAEKFAIWNMLAQVQFPWRYLSFAIIFMSLLLGESLKDMFGGNPQRIIKCLATAVGICTLMTYCFTSNYVKNAEKARFYAANDISNIEVLSGKEFLLEGTDIDILSDEISGSFKEVSLTFRDGTYMELFADIGDESGTIELPLFGYKGYHVTDESGTEYTVGTGSNNRLKFNLPAGYTGKIYVDFQAPWYWTFAEIISAVWFVFILYIALSKRLQ